VPNEEYFGGIAERQLFELDTQKQVSEAVIYQDRSRTLRIAFQREQPKFRFSCAQAVF